MKVNSENYKSLKVSLVVCFIVLVTGLFVILNDYKTGHQQEHLHEITERFKLAYDTIYSQHKILTDALSSEIINRFEVIPLYTKLVSANAAEKERIREELFANVLIRYKELQKKIQLRQLHFHLADNESFLRLHRPKKYGDNLSSVRQTVVFVNREHTAINGFEEGRIYNGYRYVFPITGYDNKHLGSVELSFGAEAFTRSMMKQHDVWCNFFIKDTIVEKNVFADEVKRNYKKSEVHEYYLDKKVLAELKQVSGEKPGKLVLDIESVAEVHKILTKKEARSIYVASLDRVITILPVFDPISGDMMAFFTIRSYSDIFQHEAEQHTTTSILSMLLLALIFITLYLQIKKRMQLEEQNKKLQLEWDKFTRGPVMTFTWKNCENWPVEHVSSNVLELLGYEPKEFRDGSILYSSLIHPDDLQQVLDEVKRRLVPGESSFAHQPYRLLHRNGKMLWILANTTLVRNRTGEITHLSGYLVDISISMDLREEIVKTQEMFQTVADFTYNWEYWVGANGELIYISPSCERITGYTQEEFLCDPELLSEVIHPDDRKLLIGHKHEIDKQGEAVPIDFRIITKDGQERWIGHNCQQVFNDAGELKGRRGSNRDISKQKEVEKKIVQAKKEAESANHAKSVFLSNMSHELRTPLNAILGYTQILTADSSLSASQQSSIRTMHQSGHHLLMLINDILDLSKVEAGKMELVTTEFRLPEFFQEVADIIRVRAQQAELEFSYEPDANLPVAIEADELKLRQIILNLLSNAIKFTSHGRCRFRVKSTLRDDRTCRLTIIVEDTGPGIDPLMQKEIFEPFQQSGERLKYSEGTGLGLAISRQMVALMGGSLQLESPVDKTMADNAGPGCRFSFTVIVALSMVNESRSKNKQVITGYSISNNEQQPIKILIVDDNISNRAVLLDTLTPLGFVCAEAEDGCEVIAACERLQPDAILMDLRMPKVDGFAAMQQLMSHKQFCHIKVIAISASNADLQKLKGNRKQYGFSGYITKPYGIEELLETLAEQLPIEVQYAELDSDNIMDENIFTNPPAEVLKQLHKLLSMGDLDALLSEVEDLAVISPEYKKFSERVQSLAAEFQLTALETLLSFSREKS